MPECRDCGRMRASCELRRLPSGGWRCKEAGKGTRCHQLARERRAAQPITRAAAQLRIDGTL
ncbi:MAG: hypothetical protein ACRDNM_00840 [Gaiellaceae bacterium]